MLLFGCSSSNKIVRSNETKNEHNNNDNSIIMENEHTALNGTTITTTTTEKKGYTPLVVWFTFFTTTLLLGLAFYAGQPIRSSSGIGGKLVLPVVPTRPLLDKPDYCTNPDKC